MVTQAEFDAAIKAKEEAQKTISQFFVEKGDAFKARMETNPVFKPEELVYASTARCKCGAGLAYPNDCGPGHYWDCGDVLLGKVQNPTRETHPQFPFSFYEIKSESQPSANGASTRPKT